MAERKCIGGEGMNNKPAILLTGCLGFLGSNLHTELINQGYTVFGVDDLSFGSLKNLGPHNDSVMNSKFQEVGFSGIYACQILIHCATINIIAAQNDPYNVIQTNALDTIRLFERFQNKKIVYISTGSVYGNSVVYPTKESDPIDCMESYSFSKKAAEMFLKNRHNNFTIIRPSNIYGKNQRPVPCGGVIGKMIYSALQSKPIKINGDGTATRDFTYVDDVVDAIIKSTELPPLNTAVNISGNCEISIEDLANKIRVACGDSGLKSPIEYIPERPIDSLKRRWLDISKAKELLGWEPQYTLEQGLSKTVEWMRKEYNL